MCYYYYECFLNPGNTKCKYKRNFVFECHKTRKWRTTRTKALTVYVKYSVACNHISQRQLYCHWLAEYSLIKPGATLLLSHGSIGCGVCLSLITQN